MSLDVLKEKIKKGNISGVILLYGAEEYTKDRYADQLRKFVESSPLPEFNHIYFNAATDDIGDLEDAFFALPYMSEYKLVEITSLSDAKITESDIKNYIRIFSDVPEYLTVLIVLRADEYGDEQKTARTSKSGLPAFVSAVSACGLAVEFDTEKADKLTPWIIKHFSARSVKYEPSVPREIINVCGSDMYILQGEITKLCEAYSSAPLTVADVHKYCCANVSYKYFDIASALNRRDLVTAKRIFDGLDLKREDIPAALGFLAKNYSDMLAVKAGLDSGKSGESIAKDLKLQPWRVGKIAQSLAGNDIRSISYAVSQIASADVKIKSSRSDPMRVLEMTFYRICTYGRKA